MKSLPATATYGASAIGGGEVRSSDSGNGWDVINKIVVLGSGFILFRIFDITKLPPARQFERFPGGLGIMADDVAAAIYANLAMHLLNSLGAFH